MPKSAAERQRECRERKRAMALATTNPEINDYWPNPKNAAKTAAERVREFRARKKTSYDADVNLNRSNSDQSQHFTVTTAKTPAERMREFRARKKTLQHFTASKAKTSAERMREFRARKKYAVDVNLDRSNSDQLEHFTGKTAKTSAERNREFRARKKTLYAADVTLDQSNADQLQYVKREFDADISDSSLPLTAESRSDTMDVREPISDSITYGGYHRNKSARNEFNKRFRNRNSNHVCSVCDRLWFKDDLKGSTAEREDILRSILPNINVENIAICSFLAYEELEAE